jgi:hypothetical protein
MRALVPIMDARFAFLRAPARYPGGERRLPPNPERVLTCAPPALTLDL